MPLDLVGKLRRAVEHHAKRIVELPEIGIVDQLAGVFRRNEAADRDAEAHDQETQTASSASTLILRSQSDSPGAARRPRLEIGALRRPGEPQPLARHRPRRVGGLLDDAGDLPRSRRGTLRRCAFGAGRDDQRQHQRRATPGFPRSGTTGRRDRDARRAAPAARRSRRASSRRRPRPCRRPRTSRSRCFPTARSGRRGRRGPARGCRRPAPCRSAASRSRSSFTQVAVSASAWRASARRLPAAPRSSRRRRRTRRGNRGRQRVGDRDDHRGAGHVHGLVAVLGDRLGRLHHVGHADHPVVRQRPEQRRVHDLGEVAKERQACVEVVGR